tara:strand:+ start:257 stop:1414 length:1158 start_codon:yes stop_codon:yes gene_type:complete
MAIPLVSNVGFTEITQSLVDSNSGVLNNIAGSRINLPIQYFKLGENISGNLTLNDVATNKKIILDTDGNTLLNPNGSPLTQNSSTTMELKGSGNIQSTKKTSTGTQASTSYAGTTTFGDSNSSTVVVGDDGFDITFNENYTLQNEPYRDKHGIRTPDNIPSGETWTGLTGTNGANISGLTANGFTFNNAGNLMIGVTGSIGNFQFYRMTNAHRSRVDNDYKVYVWCSTGMFKKEVDDASGQVVNTNLTKPDFIIGPYYNPYTGQYYSPQGSRDSGNDHNAYSNYQPSGRLESVTVNARTITFTNNLAISCVLSGADPFDNVTVNAGATAQKILYSTDGSFDVTMTISGNDGNNLPYALADVNNGTGSLDTSTQSYTGTFSVKAFS